MPTDLRRLDSHAVTDFEVLHCGMHRDNFASGLVTEDMIMLDDHRTDAAVAPEMHI